MRNITRRSILSTTAAAAVIPAAALSAVIPQAASDTEILAAIDAHRRAYNNPIWAREDYTDAEADEASDATQEAEKVLLAMPPASAAGALAVLRYARELADKHQYELFPAEDYGLAYPLLNWAERAIAALGDERMRV